MIQSYSEDSTIAFTDGSCMGNPGPCGADGCISLLGVEEPVCLKKPVSNRVHTEGKKQKSLNFPDTNSNFPDENDRRSTKHIFA